MNKIGLINIGDSPITGIEREKEIYLSDCEIWEEGALDGLAEDELKDFLWRGAGDILTVERKSGKVIRLQKSKVTQLVQQAVERARHNGCNIFYLHCTGFFTDFYGDGLFIKPGEMLRTLAGQYQGKKKVAVLTPTDEHIPQVKRKWECLPYPIDIFAVSPFEYESSLNTFFEKTKEYDLLILDCASYGIEFVEKLKAGFKGIIMCALTLSFAELRVLAYENI